MSWEATAYVRGKRICRNGEAITAREKLVMYALADRHNVDTALIRASLVKLAGESITSRGHLARVLAELERKGEITVKSGLGAGNFTEYSMVGLDEAVEAGEINSQRMRKKHDMVSPFADAGAGETAQAKGNTVMPFAEGAEAAENLLKSDVDQTVKGNISPGEKSTFEAEKVNISTTAIRKNGRTERERKELPPYPPQAGGGTNGQADQADPTESVRSLRLDAIAENPTETNPQHLDASMWGAFWLELKDDLNTVSLDIGSRGRARRPGFVDDAYDRYFRDCWIARVGEQVVYVGSTNQETALEGLEKFRTRLCSTFERVTGLAMKFELEGRA